ncbi:asparagine synthase (glutamine-hydrolyzing) [Aliarcobacter cryaerophilus]|uniref:asparagine synthase (glutamine-hydrolyzing) n=1 Tax=Aliarcobacter cryaerophilus TaxID=28198 RepID=UPI003DA4849A
MCGIFGFTKFKKEDLEKARESLHTLHHRGPDQWNDYFDEDIYMGHQRLSILDLSEHGKQPMISPDKKVIITVNGEIYNFLELKKELESKYTFKSTSDSEVVLYGYIEWGIDKLLEKIDGMYAVSIYDKEKDELFLARDRSGIKPLYYGNINGQLSWASELKAIQKLYENQNILEYDYTAFYDFLTYLYIPTPKSMYKNVYKLEPAHYLKIDIKNNTYEKIQYWQLEVKKCNDDVETAKKKIYDLVEKSVDEQMVADVPVGFFLSGGMDSSTVVSLASKNHNDINTFSIGFTDKSHDETHFAEMVADMYKTKHHKKILDEDTTKDMFHKIKNWYDEPFADTSCFPTYLVSQFAKEKSTVVLTGDGGDEVFGGYNWYKRFENLQKYSLPYLRFLKMVTKKLKKQKNILGKIARRVETQFLLNDLEIYTRLMGGMLKDEKEKYRKLWNIDEDYDDYWYFRKFYKKDLDLYTRLQYLDFHTYLHDDIFTKVDRVSMAVSLECRVPFMKKEIIEYSFSIKKEVRIYQYELKGIMKEAFRKVLPIEIIERDKKGFSIPLHSWKNIIGSDMTRQEKILSDWEILC